MISSSAEFNISSSSYSESLPVSLSYTNEQAIPTSPVYLDLSIRNLVVLDSKSSSDCDFFQVLSHNLKAVQYCLSHEDVKDLQ